MVRRHCLYLRSVLPGDGPRRSGTSDGDHSCLAASPFTKCADSHWASISAWAEGDADLGDAEECDEGDEPLSDDEAEEEED